MDENEFEGAIMVVIDGAMRLGLDRDMVISVLELRIMALLEEAE